LEVRFKVCPAQSGPLLPTNGEAGIGFTNTVVVPIGDEQEPIVARTLYTPEAAVVTLAKEGVCTLEEKPLGPVQEYVAPLIVAAVKSSV